VSPDDEPAGLGDGVGKPTPSLPAAPPPEGGPIPPRTPGRMRRWVGAVLAVAGVGLVLLAGTGVGYGPIRPEAEPEAMVAASRDDAETRQLRSDLRKLRREIDRLVPRDIHIVVDQTHNRIQLRRGSETVLEAPCSAGSGVVLREREGSRVWTFDTPRGAFRVIAKIRNPVWRKPDWAFVEEGQPIPRDPGARLEYGVLGEYGLYFGNGYLIHGTLYERFIGRSVSHGCIRVGREPLREIYRAATLGTPVLIY
jgi:hypothetical protein